MPITPDTKNWTWVIDGTCPDCGFDGKALAAPDVAALLTANADAWPAVLTRPDAARRPDDSTWSPLEYGAHVRDVFRISSTRLALMLDADDPLFANWDQDETAVEERYGEQDPETVARDIQKAGHEFAAALGRVTDDQWSRTGRRSDGAAFTVDTFARYVAHDPVHHLWDVRG
jgi:hypothetical protein